MEEPHIYRSARENERKMQQETLEKFSTVEEINLKELFKFFDERLEFEASYRWAGTDAKRWGRINRASEEYTAGRLEYNKTYVCGYQDAINHLLNYIENKKVRKIE